MKGFRSRLKGSTILPLLLKGIYSTSPQETIISATGNKFNGADVGYLIIKRLQAPPIEDWMRAEIEGPQPEFVTRHMSRRYYPDAIKGSYQFGTLSLYRAKEKDAVGRLGDVQESRRQDSFISNGHIESLLTEDIHIEDDIFTNTNTHVKLELVSNDYCSCTSTGVFDIERANKIRDAEIDPNKKPDSYVTYHLPSLKKAISNYIRNNESSKNLICLSRLVSYQEKDATINFEKRLKHVAASKLSDWIKISFFKHRKFSHEEEFRILILNPQKPGFLDLSADYQRIGHNEDISSSIFASGIFHDSA